MLIQIMKKQIGYKKEIVLTFLKQNIIPSISLAISLALLFGMCLMVLSVSDYFQLGRECWHKRGTFLFIDWNNTDLEIYPQNVYLIGDLVMQDYDWCFTATSVHTVG